MMYTYIIMIWETPQLAYCLGALVGDGYLQVDAAKYAYIIRLVVKDRDFAQYFAQQLEQATNLQTNTCNAIRSGRYVEVQAYSKKWLFLFRRAIATLPDILDQIPDDALRAYLRGYFDAEGSVSDASGLRLTAQSTNIEYVSVVYTALLRLGYHPQLNTHPHKLTKSGLVHYVSLSGIDQVKRYYEEIGITIQRKAQIVVAKDYASEAHRQKTADWRKKQAIVGGIYKNPGETQAD